MIKLKALLTASTLSLLLTACGGGNTSIGLGTGGGSGGGGTPQPAAPAGVYWSATTFNSRQQLAVIKSSASTSHGFFWLYFGTGTNDLDGFSMGTLTASGGASGSFVTGTLKYLDLAGNSPGDIALSNNLYASAPNASISGKISQAGLGPVNYTLLQQSLVDQPASTLNTNYTGQLRSDLTAQTNNVTVTLTGVGIGAHLQGTDGGSCTFGGTLSDSQITGVYLVALGTDAGNCAGDGTQLRNGVAFILNGKFYMAIADTTGSTAAVFNGS